jgi:hypothetical protein
MDCGNFSESAQNLWDFTRCQRADGSYYGTSGKCRSGNEVGAKLAKLPVEKLQKLAANPRLSSTQKKQVQTAISEKGGAAPAKTAAKETLKKPTSDQEKLKQLFLKQGELIKAGKSEEAKKLNKAMDALDAKIKKDKNSAPVKPEGTTDKEKKIEALKKAHLGYTDALKKQMEYVAKGDMAGAEKMGVKVKEAIAKVKKAEEAAKSPEKKAEEKKYAAERAEMLKKQEQRDAAQDNAKLSATQKKALTDYTKEGDEGNPRRSYNDVNKCLRDPSACESRGESLKFAKDLDGALKALPSNDAGDSFYRGVSASKGAAAQLYSVLENAKPGTVLKDPGFGSYSADRRQAENFTNNLTPTSKNIMFVSRNKSITPINRFSDIPSENEAILPRGSSQTIRSVTKKGGTLIVELD